MMQQTLKVSQALPTIHDEFLAFKLNIANQVVRTAHHSFGILTQRRQFERFDSRQENGTSGIGFFLDSSLGIGTLSGTENREYKRRREET